jgi:hypothetical protein
LNSYTTHSCQAEEDEQKERENRAFFSMVRAVSNMDEISSVGFSSGPLEKLF